MPKRRLQIWLSEAALAELERRAGAPDKRQEYLERFLTTPLFEAAQEMVDDGLTRLTAASKVASESSAIAASAMKQLGKTVQRLPLERERVVSIPKPGKK